MPGIMLNGYDKQKDNTWSDIAHSTINQNGKLWPR